MGKEVTEFVVVPPRERTGEIVSAKDRFIAHLESAFPQLKFEVQGTSPFDVDGFQVIPMMGRIGEHGGVLCDRPDPQLIWQIMKRCADFNGASALAS